MGCHYPFTSLLLPHLSIVIPTISFQPCHSVNPCGRKHVPGLVPRVTEDKQQTYWVLLLFLSLFLQVVGSVNVYKGCVVGLTVEIELVGVFR